mmetsp:Transcript_3456/g.9277  ORF Transcript_3456/g.9277 Transcript_3456/m.9277 type:complete len:295 (+) Transcript_3456:1196-2080(+)
MCGDQPLLPVLPRGRAPERGEVRRHCREGRPLQRPRLGEQGQLHVHERRIRAREGGVPRGDWRQRGLPRGDLQPWAREHAHREVPGGPPRVRQAPLHHAPELRGHVATWRHSREARKPREGPRVVLAPGHVPQGSANRSRRARAFGQPLQQGRGRDAGLPLPPRGVQVLARGHERHHLAGHLLCQAGDVRGGHSLLQQGLADRARRGEVEAHGGVVLPSHGRLSAGPEALRGHPPFAPERHRVRAVPDHHLQGDEAEVRPLRRAPAQARARAGAAGQPGPGPWHGHRLGHRGRP